MKKLLAIVTCAILIAVPSVKAQNYIDRPVNDIHFSYGQGSTNQIATIISAALIETLSLGLASVDEISGAGSIGIGYSHAVNHWLWLGGDAVFEQTTISGADEDSGEITNASLNMASLMFTCKMNWFDKAHFAMYSRLAAGAQASIDEDDISIIPAGQISPLCLEAGGLNFRGFLEGGFGCQGILIAGLRYRF